MGLIAGQPSNPQTSAQEFIGNPNGWADGPAGTETRDPITGHHYYKESGEGSRLNWKKVKTDDGDVLNVLDFPGVDNTGAHDSTEGIQRAIDAADDRQAVFFPAGTYSFGALNVTASLQGAGMNSVLKPTGTLLITASNVSITYLRFESHVPNSVVSPNNSTIIQTLNVPLSGISIEHCEFNWHSSITGMFKLAILLQYTHGLRIAFNRFYKGGIQCERGFNSEIVDNYMDMQWATNNEPIHFTFFSRGILSRNTILNSLTDAIDIYSSGDYCVIAENRCDGIGLPTAYPGYADGAISIKVIITDNAPINSSGPTLGWCERTVIIGNVIKNYNPSLENGRWYGFYIRYEDLRTVTPPFTYTDTSRNMLVANNIVDGFWEDNSGGWTNAFFAGIHYCGHGAVFSNNIITNIHQRNPVAYSQTCGIEVSFYLQPIDATTESCVFEGNVFNGEGSGILIYAADNCIFSNNIVGPDYKNNLHPRFGVIHYGATNRCQFIGNNFNLTAANPFAWSTLSVGTHVGTLTDCIITGNVARQPWVLSKGNHNIITGNVTGAFFLGTDGTDQEGTIFSNNNVHPTVNTSYGLIAYSQSSLAVIGNSFHECVLAIQLDGSASTTRAHHSIITGNISWDEVGGTFIDYTNVSVADKATLIVHSNLANNVLTAGNGALKLGGPVDVAGQVVATGAIVTAAAAAFGFITRTAILSPADGGLLVTNAAGTDFNRIQLGGTTSSFPSLQRSSANLRARLSDDSANTNVIAANAQLTGIAEYADNAAAVTAGLAVGFLYRTGDALKIVHA